MTSRRGVLSAVIEKATPRNRDQPLWGEVLQGKGAHFNHGRIVALEKED